MGFPKQRMNHWNFQWVDACQPMILRWMSWTFLIIAQWIWISNCNAQIQIIHPKVFAPISEVITFEHLKRWANMLALRHWASAAKVEPRHALVVSRIWFAIFCCNLIGGMDGLVHGGRYSTRWGTCFQRMKSNYIEYWENMKELHQNESWSGRWVVISFWARLRIRGK